MTKTHLTILLFLCLMTSTQIMAKKKSIGPKYNAVQMERLGRGLTVIHQGNGIVSVSWRLLIGDKEKSGFDLYRLSQQANRTTSEVKLNDKPIMTSTFFQDKGINTNQLHTYILKDSKNHKTLDSCRLTPEQASRPYLCIPLEKIESETSEAYFPNDVSVGDLDGDGSLEFIVSRQVGNLSTTQKGISGGTIRLEAYQLNGKRLWHLDLGPNIREGASYFSFVVYDFNGDGRAEIAIKTAEGTTFGDGQTIGDVNNDGITDYVDRSVQSNTYGKIIEGPEFISMVEGISGKELDRAPFIKRGDLSDWGDIDASQVDKMLSGIAYLDGKRPSYIISRGGKGRLVVEAWDFRNGKWTKRWVFDTDANNHKYMAFSNQNSENLCISDIDSDGKDEIISGACALDDTGSGLYSTGLGYGVQTLIGDLDPMEKGLEVFQGHHFSPNSNGCTLRCAISGDVIQSFYTAKPVNQVFSADIDPEYYGNEFWWSGSNGVYACNGKLLSGKTPTASGVIWWDGDLSRETFQKFYIYKWLGQSEIRLFDGKGKGLTWIHANLGKPCFSGDILGDWREEIIWPSENGQEIRIYTTPIPTNHRILCLMQDPVYRMGIATQNAGNNTCPNTGFYLGNDKSVMQQIKMFKPTF